LPLRTTTEASRCPRCEQPNDCALARDESGASKACWCRRESFPLGLLETSSGQDRGERCICRSCLQAWRLEHPGRLDRLSSPDALPTEANELNDADRNLD